VHVRHPSYRLVIGADAPFPLDTDENEWRLTRSRHADAVNAEVHDAIVFLRKIRLRRYQRGA
jgi:ribosomal protein S10